MDFLQKIHQLLIFTGHYRILGKHPLLKPEKHLTVF